MGYVDSDSSAIKSEFDLRRERQIVKSQVPPSLDTLHLRYAYSHEHYQQIARELETLGEYQRRREIEGSLLTGANEFNVPGYCYITSSYTDFAVTLFRPPGTTQPARPNWRESLVSHGLYANRVRASMHLFEHILRPREADPIFITEQQGALYDWLRQKYPRTIGSEFLSPKLAGGTINEHGIRHESLTALSFPNETFQFVLSFDCFEHFSDHNAGLRECARVLKRGGSLLITVPFRRDCANHIIRARDNSDGSVEHLLAPEYHGDPLRKEGCLCYYHFGWQLLDDMKTAGFRDPRACLYWSREFGYLGTEQILFIAEK